MSGDRSSGWIRMTRRVQATAETANTERLGSTVAPPRFRTLVPERRWWAWVLMGLAGPALGLWFPHWVAPFIILRPGGVGPFRTICVVAGALASAWAVGVAWVTIHRVNRVLNDLAWRDSLTGLANPRAFHRLLQQCLDGAHDRHRPFCLLVADLDHFKRVNDTYGHVAGDEVLTAVSNALVQAVRQGDVVCRMGGEEFAVLLPDTDMEQARLIAERIRAAVPAAPVPGQEPITISVGLASYPDDARDATTLVKAADDAAYAAKAAGRDRVAVWSGLPLSTKI